ncbi:MAG: AIM24 family protein [Planctomycetales bacterium]|nr:AIM24 family protein [Planctomycetales bacterium]MCA9170627.1 AIM24 family protein [Planctomycetales bacterium]
MTSTIVDAQMVQDEYRLSEFVERSRERDRHDGVFELENDRMLDVNLDGDMWIKTGSMVAYVGDVRFEREGILQHGIGKLLKKAMTGEGTRLTKATGSGHVYLADSGKTIQILRLENEAICVNGNDLLAFEPSIDWDINVMKKLTALVAGGLFNVRLQGSGMVAIGTHFEPLTLVVTPDQPVYTDPNATVAWSGSLSPEFRTDVSLKTFMGRGSGESIQMAFRGEGFVVVQPYEERPFQAGQQ